MAMLLQDRALHVNNDSEGTELEVIENFVYDFEEIYGTRHVEFAQKSVRQVISENIFSPSETWRIVALYLHYGNDPFARKWCYELTSEETITILKECFCVLPWDISDNMVHETLKKTLADNLKTTFSSFFRNRKSGVIFILQQNGVPSVISILQGNIPTETILHTLKALREVLRTESAKFREECNICEENQSNGSEGFQQNMFEMLGDRHYDCFEYNQMDELKKKIGFALFGTPQNNNYAQKELDHINSIYNCIIEQNIHAKYTDQIIITFIFNCTEPLPKEKIKRQEKNPDYNPDTDIGPVPIFVLKKCYDPEISHGCRIFIDHESRVYTSWNQYINNNRLNECLMVLPKNGCYMGDENGTVLLEKHHSPACNFDAKIAKVADLSAGGLGLGSGVVMVAAMIPAIPVAPVVLTGAAVAGAAAGTVCMVRSALSLFDMKKHKQDTNILTSKEARSAALNIAAGSVGVLGSGATAVMSEVVSRGVNVGQVGRGVVNTLNATNVAVGALALGNSIHHVYFSWQDGEGISRLTVIQLGLSTLFFVNSVYSFKTASSIIEESQTNVINQMKNELQSKNQRKMFDKMHKETIRMNGGNKQAGTADIISAIRRIPNKEEIFKILKANNKLFNKNGVKFSASGTEILLNGQALDLGSFAVLSKTQKLQVLSEMPPTPIPQQGNVNTSSLSIEIVNSVTEVKLISFGNRLFTDSTSLRHGLQITLKEFSPLIKEYLVKIAVAVIEKAVKLGINRLEEFLPAHTDPFFFVVNVVKSFAQNFAAQYRLEYEESKRRAQTDPDFNEDRYNEMYGIHPNVIDKTLYFCEVVIDLMIYRSKVIPKYLEKVFAYFLNLIMVKVVDDRLVEISEHEQEQHYKPRIPIPCCDCGGYYFVDAA